MDHRPSNPEVIVLRSFKSAENTKASNAIFTTHRAPEFLVTDNGAQFSSNALGNDLCSVASVIKLTALVFIRQRGHRKNGETSQFTF